MNKIFLYLVVFITHFNFCFSDVNQQVSELNNYLNLYQKHDYCEHINDFFISCRNIEEETTEILHSEELLLISLGYRCSTARQIQSHGWRKAAFPFDWNETPTDGLLKVLTDNFQFFYNFDYFKPHPIYTHSVLNTYYNILLAHDFPATAEKINHDGKEVMHYFLVPDWEKFFPEVKEKYIRRIHKFNSLSKYTGKVFFIRTIYPAEDPLKFEQASQLKDVIRTKFPSLNFELIFIEMSNKINNWIPDNDSHWNKIDTKKFIIQDYGFYSPDTERVYKEIFESLGIKKRS